MGARTGVAQAELRRTWWWELGAATEVNMSLRRWPHSRPRESSPWQPTFTGARGASRGSSPQRSSSARARARCGRPRAGNARGEWSSGAAG